MSERLVLPIGATPCDDEARTPSEIPAPSDGDFLLSEREVRNLRCVPHLQNGFELHPSPCMNESIGLLTPTDAETGLPLPLIPLNLGFSARNMEVDFHHGYHTEESFKQNAGLRALRTARGQCLPRWLHWKYHEYFSGPLVPTDEAAIFRSTVMAAAGVLPKQGIDFKSGAPQIRDITRPEQRLLARYVHVEGELERCAARHGKKWQDERYRTRFDRQQRKRIGSFFAEYAVEQRIDDVVSPVVIDEFLFTPKPSRRRELGDALLKAAIDVSVDPIRPLYHNLHNQGAVISPHPEPRSVVQMFFRARFRQDYHNALLDKLAS